MTETYRYHRQTQDDKRNCSLLQGKLALPESAGAMNHAVAMAMECHEPRSAAIEESTDAKAWIPLDPHGRSSGQCGRDRSRCGTSENVGRNCTGGIAFHGIADFV